MKQDKIVKFEKCGMGDEISYEVYINGVLKGNIYKSWNRTNGNHFRFSYEREDHFLGDKSLRRIKEKIEIFFKGGKIK
jgi:hypothetical protein